MKKNLLKIAVGAAIAAAFTIMAGAGLFYTIDSGLNDAIYQRPRATDGEVVIIGIDDKSIDTIGPISGWGRDIMAMAIEALNADSENRPAVIGIDVMYIGETNEDADAYLASAAKEAGNVVVASAATFGAELVEDVGGFYMDDYAVLLYEQPYEALSEAAGVGHINAMYDADGIMRHSILYIELPDGTRVPSFNYAIYEKYAGAGFAEGGALPLTDSRHRWLIPFAKEPGGYDNGLSLSDLIMGNIPSDFFKDKIVLIGPYAAGLQDDYITAIDHAKPMYGVELQANAVEALITGDFKAEVPDALQLLLLFAACFFCAWWFWDRKILPVTLVWAALAGGWLLLSYGLYQAGYALHSLWIPLSVSIIYVGSVAANYMRASGEKRKVTNIFKRYVAPEIVSEILREESGSLELGGKMTDIAVLFVDIRGFTPMSELLSPHEVVQILNEYLTLTSSCIINNKGTLDKFVGDATMAIWGAPLPQDDYIMKAAQTALDIVAGAEALNANLQKKYGRTVGFGVGVHCGEAIVGNIGAPMRMDFTAIGDTVNTAARLESNAKAGQILISRAVADALTGRITVTSLGNSIKLKGKTSGFEVLTLDGLSKEDQSAK